MNEHRARGFLNESFKAAFDVHALANAGVGALKRVPGQVAVAARQAPGALRDAAHAAPGAVADYARSVPGRIADFGRRQSHAITGGGVADAAHAARIGLNPQHWEEGITSIPGVAKGLVNTPRQTADALSRSVLTGRMNKVMAMAPAALAVSSLLRGDESATGGRTLKSKAMDLTGQIGLGLVTGGLPMATATALNLAGSPLISKLTERA